MTAPPPTTPQRCWQCDAEVPENAASCPRCRAPRFDEAIEVWLDQAHDRVDARRQEAEAADWQLREQHLTVIAGDLRKLLDATWFNADGWRKLAIETLEAREALQQHARDTRDHQARQLDTKLHPSLRRLQTKMIAANKAIDAIVIAGQQIPDTNKARLARLQASIRSHCDKAKHLLAIPSLHSAPLRQEKKPRPNETLDYFRMRMIGLCASLRCRTKVAHQYTRRIEITYWRCKNGDTSSADAWKNDQMSPKIGPDGLVDDYRQVLHRKRRRAKTAKSQ